jgi:hypothetical protein
MILEIIIFILEEGLYLDAYEDDEDDYYFHNSHARGYALTEGGEEEDGEEEIELPVWQRPMGPSASHSAISHSAMGPSASYSASLGQGEGESDSMMGVEEGEGEEERRRKAGRASTPCPLLPRNGNGNGHGNGNGNGHGSGNGRSPTPSAFTNPILQQCVNHIVGGAGGTGVVGARRSFSYGAGGASGGPGAGSRFLQRPESPYLRARTRTRSSGSETSQEPPGRGV